jgi:pilus assembly protein Flp/PilA
MINLIARLKARAATQDRGATAVEYGLIVALIAAVIVVVVVALGQNILAAFNTVNEQIGGMPEGE